MSEVEMWLVVMSAVAAVIPWAFSIHAKVAVIANAVESLPEMVQELREALAEHEDRLDEHEKEIAALKAQTDTRH
jgi:ABC-type molybdate transport system permease subunit